MMNDFLSRILQAKEQEVQRAEQKVPEPLLRDSIPARRSRRSLLENLTKPGPHGANIIAEIKRASPSRGPIRLELDAASLARSYEEGGAAAVSVLTDRSFFKALPHDLETVRRSTTLPVLKKDFIVSTYQIYQAASVGADAVLLIVRALSVEKLREFLELCTHLELDALVEVHSAAELEVATEAGARLVGINNRDLASFKTDIQTSISLVKMLDPAQVAVAESGIGGRDQMETLLEAGIWNFLIGESLVRAPDAKAFLGELLGIGRKARG